MLGVSNVLVLRWQDTHACTLLHPHATQVSMSASTCTCMYMYMYVHVHVCGVILTSNIL